MDKETRALYLNNIEEMVIDEGKVITYHYLSRKLCIHVNESKLLLKEFVDNQRKSNPNKLLNVNFLISGLKKENKATTFLCSEKDLAEKEADMSVIFFHHIYSVNEGKSTIDKVALVAVDRFDDFPLCLGIIKNNLSSKRTHEEICNLKGNSYKALLLPAVKDEPKVKITASIHQSNQLKRKSPVKDNQRSPSKTNVQVSPVKKEAKKTPTKNETSKTQNKNTRSDSAKTIKSKSNIASFFSKPNGQSNGKCSLNDTQKIKVKQEASPQEHVNVKTGEEKLENGNKGGIEKNATKKEEKKVQVKKEDNKKEPKKPVINIKKNAKVDKKRKRALKVSDSEESDEDKDPFSEEPMEKSIDSDEDVIPPTPCTNTVKITSGIINPKKRRKVVDKTYTDEDGYILTKKEEVLESCSEDEIDKKENIVIPNVMKEKVVEGKRSPSKPTKGKKKPSPPQKGKQATLMSFFTKSEK